MKVVATTEAISCAKLQSKCHYQQTNTQFFYRPDALPVTQPTQCQNVKALKGKYHIPWSGLAYPKLTWGLPTLSLTTKSSGLPWGGLPCLSSAL